MNLSFLTQYFGGNLSAIEKKLGLYNGYLGKLEKNIIEKPKLLTESLKSIGLNPDYFLTGEGSPELLPSAVGTAPPAEQGLEERLVPYLNQMMGAAARLGGANRILEIPGSEGLPPLRHCKCRGTT